MDEPDVIYTQILYFKVPQVWELMVRAWDFHASFTIPASELDWSDEKALSLRSQPHILLDEILHTQPIDASDRLDLDMILTIISCRIMTKTFRTEGVFYKMDNPTKSEHFLSFVRD